jgi:hypothetical protein
MTLQWQKSVVCVIGCDGNHRAFVVKTFADNNYARSAQLSRKQKGGTQ